MEITKGKIIFGALILAALTKLGFYMYASAYGVITPKNNSTS
jgi:hypothetical protein